MNYEPLVSIIIPARRINDYLQQAVSRILELDYGNFEIFVLPDEPIQESFAKTKVIVAGKTSPAQKRDLAAKQASGQILAFLDDDAYPAKDWLKNAVPYFKDSQIAAVCGPGITPPEDSLEQKVSGWVSSSLLGGGGLGFRFLPKRKREVKDFPSMNFLVRRSDFGAIGGFNSRFWPGEDTKFCLDLTKKLGKKIIYDPKILVFHHRRPVLGPHLEQICRYGLHRGYFAKILPETSRKPLYFAPMIFIIFLIALPIFGAFVIPWWHFLVAVYLWVLVLYVFLLVLTGVWVFFKERKLKIVVLTMLGIFLTHFCYGFCFLRGLFANNLSFRN